ncbi:hypothetical protein GLYMA_16G168350v4 [Glycine max]|nr:hypothetical protein GLYMA_16G168350v4 [Glycine max]
MERLFWMVYFFKASMFANATCAMEDATVHSSYQIAVT